MKLEPLTPKDDLHKTDNNFKVYKSYLDDAFANPKIRNLALSGGLGSGKSSIIRSYDRARNGGKKQFLYISLMDFSNPSVNNQKQLEHSLLNQIMSCCTEKDLREGSIKGIPEKFKHLKFCAGCLSALCFAIFMLIFHEQFGNLVVKFADFKFFGFTPSNFITEEYRALAHLTIYAFVGAILSICVYRILCRCLPFFRLSKLTLKANNAEAELFIGKEPTILDISKFELAYTLEQIGKKYDYTVVFEDLERLNPDVKIDIMEKLRELNTLTNNHIQTVVPRRALKIIRKYAYMLMPKNSPDWLRKRIHACCSFLDKRYAKNLIRFVYVISDSVLSMEHRAKFYDCIIPIVPISNPLNGKKQLQDMLNELQIHTDYHQNLLDALSDAILDYRTRLTLKNEFLVFWNLYTSNNYPAPKTRGQKAAKKAKEDWEALSHTACNKGIMFAIAAYKVLLPQCFEYALSPQGNGILPMFNSPKDEAILLEFLKQENSEKILPAIRSLYDAKLLDDSCLRLVIGEQQMMRQWLNILQRYLDKDKPSNADLALAERVIPAVESISPKPVDEEFYDTFRDKMTTRLHTLCSINQEKHFMLVAKSLASMSRLDDSEDWGWLICAHTKESFRNCIKFLAVSSMKPTTPPCSQDISFIDWCTNILDGYQNVEMCDQTGWDDQMAHTLAWYLNMADPYFRTNYKNYAAYLINDRTLAHYILSLNN